MPKGFIAFYQKRLAKSSDLTKEVTLTCAYVYVQI